MNLQVGSCNGVEGWHGQELYWRPELPSLTVDNALPGRSAFINKDGLGFWVQGLGVEGLGFWG